MSVYKRGDNWYVDFVFKGQRIRESIGPSRKGAEKVIAKKKAEIAENKYLDVRKDPAPVKFHDFAKEFLEWAMDNHKPASRPHDVSKMRILDKTFGDKNIHEITDWEIEKWKLKRKKEVSSSTVNRELGQLKSVFSKAVEWKKLTENPAKEVKLFKGSVKRLRYLMPEEVQRLIESCPEYLKPIVIVAVHTGMRRGEILGLRWNRVDLEKGKISLTDTKNSEDRVVFMNETVKATLDGLGRREGLIFDVGVNLMKKDYDEALEKAGIEDFTFHDLRHTFASNLAMAGVDLNDIRELLGHKNIAMTLRYAHLSPAHKSRAVTILDSLLTQNPPQEKEEISKVLEFKRK
jgi:integrase